MLFRSTFLGVDVALDRFSRDVPGSRSEVRAGPQRRQFEQMLELLPQPSGSDALALLDHFGSRICWPAPDEQVDMIGLNGQLQNVPPTLRTLDANLVLAFPTNIIHEDMLAPLGAPDKVVNDEVNTVFVPLVFHASIVDVGISIDKLFNSG